MTADGEITATVKITNTGRFDGEEVVQMYIRDMVRSNTPPIKELKGFQKVTLKAGETQEIRFVITTDLLAFYRYDMSFSAEPGTFEILIGGNSEELISKSFDLRN
jgi:beta-glucosidase